MRNFSLVAMMQAVAVTVQAGALTPPASELKLWQYLSILAFPAILSTLLTIILVRYLRAMRLADNGVPAKMSQVFTWSMLYGCAIQALTQAGLQKTVAALTGMPTQWELFLLAPFGGLLAMLGYEALRWVCVWRWNASKNRAWKAILVWLEVKPGSGGDDDGGTSLDQTEFMDKTVPNFVKQDP